MSCYPKIPLGKYGGEGGDLGMFQHESPNQADLVLRDLSLTNQIPWEVQAPQLPPTSAIGVSLDDILLVSQSPACFSRQFFHTFAGLINLQIFPSQNQSTIFSSNQDPSVFLPGAIC